MSATRSLCERLQAIDFAALPPATVARARELVLDGLAVAVAGSLEAAPRILAEHAAEQGGRPLASLIGFADRLAPVAAASVNGASMHVLDYEPMWSPANHQLSTTLPAALALAEALVLPAREVVAALVKGIEVQGLIRAASRQFEPRQLRFHPPGLTGAIGSAVAAGHLLGLDVDRLCHAVGIAASRAGALLANAGTMTKCTHCGLAGALGLEAALLANRGFTANPEIFEAPLGYVAAFFGEGFDWPALAAVRPPFRVVEPGYAIKLYPSQYATHFAITAALELRARLGADDEIAAATLVAPVMPYIDKPAPRSGLEGKFSFQYTTAVALLDGAVTTASFTDERRFAADVATLLPRVRLVQDQRVPANFEAMHVELAVETAAGKRLSARCDGPPGPWGAEPVTAERHLLKVRDCLSRRLGPEAVAGALAAVARFERLSAVELAELMALLGPGPACGP